MTKISDIWFDPKDLLWRTRGLNWDYKFVSLPAEPQAIPWWSVYNQVLGSRKPEEKPVLIYGQLVYGRFFPLFVQSRPFVATSYRDPKLQDKKGRAIAHDLIWVVDPSISLRDLKTVLPENWYEQILTILRPFFETDEVFRLSEDQIGPKGSLYLGLENYLRTQVQQKANAALLASTKPAPPERWVHIADVRLSSSSVPRMTLAGVLLLSGGLLWATLSRSHPKKVLKRMTKHPRSTKPR
jgi:hypothetical protein